MTTLTDLYPSRVSDEVAILERKDPVLYGRSGPLRSEQAEFYERNGYLFLEGFFSEQEVQAMRDELNRVWQVCSDLDDDEVVREPGGDEIRSVFRAHQTSDLFNRIARSRRLLDIVRQILGSEVYIHQSRINFKPGFKGKEFDWHSDFETWHVEDGMPRMRAVSCSIALTDNNPHNGPLMLIPGSQHHFISCAGKTPENNYATSLRKQEVGVPDDKSLMWLTERAGGIDAALVKAGSVVLFECNTMHGSNTNLSPYPRSNLFLVYNSVENALVAPFSGLAPRPEYLAHREVEALTPAD